jgi:hypothetical protein
MRIKNWKALYYWASLTVALALGGGCVLDLYGEAPVDQSIYYPVSMASSQDGKHLYVLSSNYDQRFNTGWVSVVDVDAVLERNGDVTATSTPLRTRAAGGQVSVLNLGGMLALDSSGEHLLVSHRGQNHLSQTRLSWIDIGDGGGSIACGDADFTGDMTAQEGKTDCDEGHIVRIEEDGGDDTNPDYTTDVEFRENQFENALSIASFDLKSDDGTSRSMMAVGFVSSGYVRLYEIIDGNPVFVETLDAALTGGGQMVYREIAGDQYLLVGGRGIDGDAVAALDLTESLNEDDAVTYAAGLEGLVAASVLGLDASPTGERIYVGSGDPRPGFEGVADVLAVLDGTAILTNEHTSNDLVGESVVRPSLDVVSVEPLLGRPSAVRYVARGPDALGNARDDLVVVSAFDGDALYIFVPTPEGARPVARIELDTRSSDQQGVGQGPFSIEVLEREGRILLFVANFFEHSLSVFDLSAASPSDFWQVAKVQNETIDTTDIRR